MIDELDLAFDEQAERGKPRHRRGARGKDGQGGKSGGKSAVAFLMAFILLAVLGGGVYFGYNKVRGFFTAADYDGDGTGTVQVADQGARDAHRDGQHPGRRGRGEEHEGVHRRRRGQPARQEHPVRHVQPAQADVRPRPRSPCCWIRPSRVSNGITHPRGQDRQPGVRHPRQGAPASRSRTSQAAGKDPEALGVPDFWFNRTDGQKVTKSIEGFLFPDTYEFQPQAPPRRDARGRWSSTS